MTITLSPFNLNPLLTPPAFFYESAVWLDATDSSTITLSEGKVSEWRDKSGNNRHAVQTNSNLRPLVSENEIGDTQTLTFNNSQWIWLSSSFNIQSIIILFRYSLPINSYDIIYSMRFQASSLVPNSVSSRDVTLGFWDILPDVYSLNDVTTYHNGVEILKTTRFFPNTTISATHSFFSVNTATPNILYTAYLPTGTGTKNFVIGTDTFTQNGARNFSGNISQILIFSRTLTRKERESAEGYLAWSTGTQSVLPSNHPHKHSYPSRTIL
jgi:hypothetical protein